MSREDFARMNDRLRHGSVSDWEAMSQADTSFPNGADGVIGRRWILNAIDVGSPACVKWMLARGVELEFRDAEGRNVLDAIIERTGDLEEKYEILAALIEAGADLDAFGFNGWAPLHLAAARNDLTALRMLLDAGAHRHLRTQIDDRATPLEVALDHGHEEAARMLRG